jgi:hypothetical protein
VTDAELEQLEREIAGVCRCLTCCCKPGQGHNHPRWSEYLRELDLRDPGDMV